MRQYRMAVLAVGLLGPVACSNEDPAPTTPTSIVIVNNNTNNNGNPGGGSPSPGAGSCAAVATVRVNPFGIRCPSGTPTPRNGEGILPLACLADLTATPKDSSGTDVPAAIHGQNIVWSVIVGAERIRLVDESNPFNKTIVPVSVGPVTIEATVTPQGCGPVKGSYTFNVTNGSGATAFDGLPGPDSPPPTVPPRPLRGN